MQIALGNGKIYLFSFQHMSLAYTSFLSGLYKTTSTVGLSAVFGAPIFSQLGRCAHITGEEKESQDQYQVLPGPLLFQI